MQVVAHDFINTFGFDPWIWWLKVDIPWISPHPFGWQWPLKPMLLGGTTPKIFNSCKLAQISMRFLPQFLPPKKNVLNFQEGTRSPDVFFSVFWGVQVLGGWRCHGIHGIREVGMAFCIKHWKLYAYNYPKCCPCFFVFFSGVRVMILIFSPSLRFTHFPVNG